MSDKDCKDFALVIPLTRGRVAVVDLEDYNDLNRFKWHALKINKTWYARRWPTQDKPEWMHRVIARAKKTEQVDHKNRDGLDNRRDNLRTATASLNGANRSRVRHAGNPFKGVKWAARRGTNPPRPWSATLKKDYQQYYLGSFYTAEEAARAYDSKAREFFGEFARLNFPRDGEQQA